MYCLNSCLFNTYCNYVFYFNSVGLAVDELALFPGTVRLVLMISMRPAPLEMYALKCYCLK